MANSQRTVCRCAQCKVRGLMIPFVLITIGALFLAGQYSRYGFFDLWPIILIVVGAILVVQALVSPAGHLGQ